jgi:hypothetical protein
VTTQDLNGIRTAARGTLDHNAPAALIYDVLKITSTSDKTWGAGWNSFWAALIEGLTIEAAVRRTIDVTVAGLSPASAERRRKQAMAAYFAPAPDSDQDSEGNWLTRFFREAGPAFGSRRNASN